MKYWCALSFFIAVNNGLDGYEYKLVNLNINSFVYRTH